MLLELADDPCQQVDRVRIDLLLGDGARGAAFDQVLLDALGQQLDVLEVARRFLRVLGNFRACCDVARGAVGLGAQRDGALGDAVVVRREADGEGLEQRVQRGEVRSKCSLRLASAMRWDKPVKISSIRGWCVIGSYPI